MVVLLKKYSRHANVELRLKNNNNKHDAFFPLLYRIIFCSHYNIANCGIIFIGCMGASMRDYIDYSNVQILPNVDWDVYVSIQSASQL